MPRLRRRLLLSVAVLAAAIAVVVAGGVEPIYRRLAREQSTGASDATTDDNDVFHPTTTAVRTTTLRPTDDRPAPTSDPVDHPGWTQLFGPDLNSVSTERGATFDWPAAGPTCRWRRALGAGYSAPVAVDDHCFALFRRQDEEVLGCFRLDDGEPVWEQTWPTDFVCKFERYSSGPYSTPVIDGERIYTVGAQANLHCFDRRDGRRIWQRSLMEDFQAAAGLFGFGAGILIDQQRLYLNVGGVEKKAGVVALDKRTGDTLWQSTRYRAAYTTPRLLRSGDARRLLVLTESGLVAVDPQDGRECAFFEFHPRGADVINAVTPVVADGFILLVSGPGPGSVCLRLLPGDEWELVWRDRRVLDSQFNSVISHGGYVYGFTASQQGGSKFRCVELASGKLQWSHESDLGRGQGVAAGGRILLLGEKGHWAVLDLHAAELTVRAMSEQPLLQAPCYSQPALHRGRVLLRNEHELICISSPVSSPTLETH